MTDQLPPRLAAIGDALEHAARHNLIRTRPAAARSRVLAKSRHPRRLAAILAALVIVIPGGAIAATQLFSNDDVAASIPAGTLALLNTHPACTTVTAGVEYHCTLARVPSDSGAPVPNQWLGTVEATVDATKHVNGGCRSLNAAGTEWECYIGEKAVAEQIIGQGFLGAYAPSPGVG